MRKIQCTLTIDTYNSLLNGLCYVGRIDEALHLLRKIEKTSNSKSTKPDIYPYTTLMYGFCKVGRSDEAMELLEEAMELGLNPTVVTFNSLLNGYSKEGRPLKGVAVLSQMVSRDCRPDIISYTILLLGLLKWGEIPEALLIYKDMMKLGFQADERVMNTLLRGICKEVADGDREWLREAEAIFGKIYEMGFRVSPYTYSLMIQALCRCGEDNRAFSNLMEMFGLGQSPTLMTCNIVMRLLCRDKRIDGAFVVFGLMIESAIIQNKNLRVELRPVLDSRYQNRFKFEISNSNNTVYLIWSKETRFLENPAASSTQNLKTNNTPTTEIPDHPLYISTAGFFLL